MRAAVINEPHGEIIFEERRIPTFGPDEVLIRVRACGVCGGDLKVRHGQFPFIRYPLVMGHEIAGTIEAVGERVLNLKPGANVGVSALYSSCGTCPQCLGGDDCLCERVAFTGATKDGGYQEYMVADAAYVAPLPKGLDFADAAPLMCAGLTVYSGIQHAGFRPGYKVAVIGLGGFGQMAVLFAKAMGARVAVLATSYDQERCAQQLGAECFINIEERIPAEALTAWDGGADLVLATVPNAETIAAAFAGVAIDGTMMVLSPPAAPISISPLDLIRGRRRLMGSASGSRNDLRNTMAFAVAHGIRVPVNRVAFEELPNVFADMETGKVQIKTVVVMD